MNQAKYESGVTRQPGRPGSAVLPGTPMVDVASLRERWKSLRVVRPVGRVLGSDGAISAELSAAVGDVCQIETSRGDTIQAEVIGFRDHLAHLLPYDGTQGLAVGDRVLGLGNRRDVACGSGLLGRVIDGLGRPLDGLGSYPIETRCPIVVGVPNPMRRQPIQQQFFTGQRPIDGLLSLGVGQRVGLFAGSGVGKSTLLGQIARYAESDCNVIALVGERGREVRPFIEESLGEIGLRRSVVVVATSDQSPLLRIRAALAAVTIASYFRDQGKKVLLLFDSITRLASAQREIGILLREPPAARGFTPSVFRLLTSLLEQLGNNDRGSITGILTILVDGDDTEEPVSDAVRSIVDGHIVLDRELAERGHYPAIRVSRSISRVFEQVTSAEHQRTALAIRRAMATYDDFADVIRLGIYQTGSSPLIDRAVQLMPEIERFLRHVRDEVSSPSATLERMRLLARQWPLDAGK